MLGREHKELRFVHLRSFVGNCSADPICELQHLPGAGAAKTAETACPQDQALFCGGWEDQVSAHLLQQQGGVDRYQLGKFIIV